MALESQNQNGTLAVSFDSDSKWDKTEIALIYRFQRKIMRRVC
jgi:hypothetical protein